jgi:CubicO group peptidase (beta-lactamase class C family)
MVGGIGRKCIAALVVACPLSAGATDPQAEFEPLVQQAMQVELTPGLAVAVVQGDRILWSAGFGLADRETNRPVTPETRFYIASTSKALIALAVARLAERGTLAMDEPIRSILPAARLADGVDPDSVTLRSLLTHTHGMQAQGPVTLRVSFTGEYTNADLLSALALHIPARSGHAFTYSNLGYEVVGVALAPETTGGWKAVVEREVLEPLGMNATTAYASRVPENLRAEPYDIGANGVERVPLRKHDANMGPAGGHFSTASDLARLIIAELNQGGIDGRQVIEPVVIAETQRQQVAQTRAFPPFNRHGWGLGWDLGTYEADTLLQRFGVFEGYRCHVSFMPDHRLGVVVLLNGGIGASGVADALAASIYDRLVGRDSVEARLETRLATVAEAAQKRRDSIAADLAKRAARPKTPSRPLDFYAGTYVHPQYGTLVVEVRGEHLAARLGFAESPMEVFDLEKEMFRVDFVGSGWVVGARTAPEAAHPHAMQMIDVEFTRRD